MTRRDTGDRQGARLGQVRPMGTYAGKGQDNGYYNNFEPDVFPLQYAIDDKRYYVMLNVFLFLWGVS